MSQAPTQLRVPLVPRFFRGVRTDRAELVLCVRCRPPHPQKEEHLSFPFIVDTGADMTMIPARVAKYYHIPFDEGRGLKPETVRALGGTLSGRMGQVSVLLMGRWFNLSCFFYDEAKPPASLSEWQTRTQRALARPKSPTLILGRADFIGPFGIELVNHDLVVTSYF